MFDFFLPVAVFCSLLRTLLNDRKVLWHVLLHLSQWFCFVGYTAAWHNSRKGGGLSKIDVFMCSSAIHVHFYESVHFRC